MIRDESVEYTHTLCNKFAPTSREQQGFAKLRRELESDPDANETNTVEKMLSALLDGMTYGNWPQP